MCSVSFYCMVQSIKYSILCVCIRMYLKKISASKCSSESIVCGFESLPCGSYTLVPPCKHNLFCLLFGGELSFHRQLTASSRVGSHHPIQIIWIQMMGVWLIAEFYCTLNNKKALIYPIYQI